METFYKVCVILLIIGGVNWGLVGLFSFDAVGWLLGGSASLLSRIVFTVVGVAAVCAIPCLLYTSQFHRQRAGSAGGDHPDQLGGPAGGGAAGL